MKKMYTILAASTIGLGCGTYAAEKNDALVDLILKVRDFTVATSTGVIKYLSELDLQSQEAFVNTFLKERAKLNEITKQLSEKLSDEAFDSLVEQIVRFAEDKLSGTKFSGTLNAQEAIKILKNAKGWANNTLKDMDNLTLAQKNNIPMVVNKFGTNKSVALIQIKDWLASYVLPRLAQNKELIEKMQDRFADFNIEKYAQDAVREFLNMNVDREAITATTDLLSKPTLLLTRIHEGLGKLSSANPEVQAAIQKFLKSGLETLRDAFKTIEEGIANKDKVSIGREATLKIINSFIQLITGDDNTEFLRAFAEKLYTEIKPFIATVQLKLKEYTTQSTSVQEAVNKISTEVYGNIITMLYNMQK